VGIEHINLEPSRNRFLQLSVTNYILTIKAHGMRDCMVALMIQCPSNKQRIIPVQLIGDSAELDLQEHVTTEEGNHTATGYNIPSNLIIF
jgi:hypothetical protein